MRLIFLALAGLIAAAPAFADDATCDIAITALNSAHKASASAHESGKQFIDAHPDDFICDPLFLPLMQGDVAAIEMEIRSATTVRTACAGNAHYVAEMDEYIPSLEAWLAKARESLGLVESNCPVKP